jgi:hypothetical protein
LLAVMLDGPVASASRAAAMQQAMLRRRAGK